MTARGRRLSIPSAPEDRLPREGETIFKRSHKPDYVIDEDGCWIWQKGMLNGYPIGGGSGYPTNRVHRLYYLRAYGSITDGFDVHHRCEVPACINPNHLEAKLGDTHREDHGLERAGLSREDIDTIRELARDRRYTQREIAARFGIAQSAVSQISTGVRWKRLGAVDKMPRVCGHAPCDGTIMPGGAPHQVYCSDACREAAKKIRRNKPSTFEQRARKAALQRVRRARLKDAA